MASDEEGRKVMELMYGVNLLRKLIEQYEKEQEQIAACEKYLRENTVPSPFHTTVHINDIANALDALPEMWYCVPKDCRM